MPFTVQTYFPWTSNGQHVDFKAIRGTSAGAGDGTTQAAFATNATARYILAKPLVSNSTSATPAANQGFGWDFLTTELEDFANAPNKRRILAGDWTFHCVLSASAADTSSQFAVKVYVHHVNTFGVVTELFNVESTAAAITTSINVTMTKTGVAQVLLGVDENIKIEYWVRGRGGGTTGAVNQTITFRLGTTSLFQEMDFVIPSPGMRTLFLRTLTAAGIGLVTRFFLKIKRKLTASGAGIATVARRLTLKRAMTVTGAGVAKLNKKTFVRMVTTGVGLVKGYVTLLFAKVPAGGGGTTEVDVSGKYGAAITVQTTTPSAGGVIIKCVLLILDTNSVPQKISGTSPTPTIEVEPTAYVYEHVSDSAEEDAYLGSSGLSLISGSTDEWAGDLNTPGLTVGKDYSVIVAWKINGIQSQSKCDFRYDNTLAQDSAEANRLIIALEPQVGEGFKFQQGVGLKIKAWLENSTGDLVANAGAGFGGLIISRVQKDSTEVQNLFIESFYGTGVSTQWLDVVGGDPLSATEYAMSVDPNNEYIQTFTLSETDTQWGATPVQIQVNLKDANEVYYRAFVTVQ